MDIRPFRGWHYCGPDISSQIAPPYDVLSEEDKKRLLSADKTNIVAVDLPHTPPSDVGPDAVYKDAAKLLEKWKDRAVLCRDEKPAVYAYQQDYTWAGKTYSRRALLTGVRATELGVDVMPHEHTFAGPKADRLKLTTATHTQLSPIFGFFADPGKGLINRIWESLPEEPVLCGELEGVVNKLWVVTDDDLLNELKTSLKDEKVYIADGHHRYTTALNFAEALQEAGIIEKDHEAHYVLFALVDRDEPGLLVLPTHRIIYNLAEFNAETLCEKLSEKFEVTPFEGLTDLSDADAFLSPLGKGVIGMLSGQRAWTLKLRNPETMKQVAAEQSKAWRDLDVAVLHSLIMDEILRDWTTDQTHVSYTPHGNDAWNEVKSGRADVSFVLQHTPLESVQSVADAGESMPHKSTYFYPKIATGMILKPLE